MLTKEKSLGKKKSVSGKKILTIPKRASEVINRRTDNTMERPTEKRQKDK